MIRETSIEAYKKIKENGLLSKINFLVYDCIAKHGPMTIKEVTEKLTDIPATSISPCFAKLENQGVLKTNGKRKCTITNMSSLEWDLTDNVPNGKKRKATIRDLRQFIKSEYDYLNTACAMNDDNFQAYHGLRDSWKNKLTKLQILE